MQRCWCQSKDVKVGFYIKFYVRLDLSIGIGVGYGVGIYIGDELYSGDCDEFGDGVEL